LGTHFCIALSQDPLRLTQTFLRQLLSAVLLVQESQIEPGMTLHKPLGSHVLTDLDDLDQASLRLAFGEGNFFQNKTQVFDGGPKPEAPGTGRHLEINLGQTDFQEIASELP